MNEFNSIDEQIIEKYLVDTINEEEQRKLLSWIDSDPKNKEVLFALKDIYDVTGQNGLITDANTNRLWSVLKGRIREKPLSKVSRIKQPNLVFTIRKYVAVFIIGMITSGFISYFMSTGEIRQEPTICKVTTGKGEKATLILPDGSHVRLNACSQISYPSNFGEKSRILTFSGEAYFDVKTNRDIPFTVKTFGYNIKALGTAFNVKAYPDEKIVQATLVRGIVTIEKEDNFLNETAITLAPAQVVTIPKQITSEVSTQQITTEKAPVETVTSLSNVNEQLKNASKEMTYDKPILQKVDPEVYTSWKDGRMIIDSEPLEELVRKLERQYNVTFVIDSEIIKKYKFSGTLRDFPLEQVMEAIRLNAPILYTIKGRDVVIKENKQYIPNYDKLMMSNP